MEKKEKAMEVEVKVTSLSHDALVNLFSSATFGNSAWGIEVPEQWKHLKKGTCWEDGLASVILGGGCLDMIDCYSEYNKDSWEPYGKNYVSVRWEEFETAPWVKDGSWGHVVYRINLDNILKGMSTEKGYELAKELLIDEEGDMYTADRLMQIICFEEEIYG